MKILVTGYAGFIGSNLSKYLLDSGYEVVGIDNFNSFYNPKIKEYHVKDFSGNERFKSYKIDLLDDKELNKVFEENRDISGIIHLAAWAGVTNSIEQPVVYVRNNIEATVKLLEFCKQYEINNFIFASTSSIYGDNPTPFQEGMTTDFSLAPYPATKKACEVLIYTYAKNFKINSTIFRIFNPCGPRMRPDLALPMLVRSCLYGIPFPQYWTEEAAKKTGRDYCYVNHIFEAMISVLQKPKNYEVYNLGNSSPVALADVISTVEKVTGNKANIKLMPPRPGEMLMTYADISKAKESLGYNPKTSLEQIVKIYHDWFVSQEEWYRKGQY